MRMDAGLRRHLKCGVHFLFLCLSLVIKIPFLCPAALEKATLLSYVYSLILLRHTLIDFLKHLLGLFRS